MKEYKRLLKQVEDIKKEIKRIDLEKEEKIHQIREKYQILIDNKNKEYRNAINKLDEYNKKISDYSIFNESAIGNAIAMIISIFEGEDYIYLNPIYYTKKEKISTYAKDEYVWNHPRIIVLEEEKKDSYHIHDNDLGTLIENGKALILVDNAITLDNIKFYEDSYSNNIDLCIDFGKFDYVIDFINYLISYKMEKDTKVLSTNNMVKLTLEYIKQNANLIKERYQIMANRKKEEAKQQIEAEKERRQLKLSKIINN